MLYRSDGLLTSSREDRIAAMLLLKEAGWNVDTVLDLHRGLLDHAEDVRLAAIEALKGIAERLPEPLSVTPVTLLAVYLFSFTVSSGATPDIFAFLVKLNTPEALRAAEEALEHVGRNEDFEAFAGILLRANKRDILQRLQKAKLSKVKAKILQQVLGGKV